MDEKGYSWPETMLTLTIVIIIFGTLLPLATKLTTVLYNKEQSMRATETAYQGSILYNTYGINEGTRSVEGSSYNWLIEREAICVTYLVDDKAAIKCVNY